MPKPKQTRIAALMMTGVGALQCWPVWRWGRKAATDLAAPPLSDQRTWAYLPATVAGALAVWAALAFILAFGLGTGKRHAWIMALAYATVSALCSVVFARWWATPLYVATILYLCMGGTRKCYRRKEKNARTGS